MDDTSELLKSIDTKLNALLALAITERLSATESPRKDRSRPLDVVLSEAGLTTKEISVLLAKTDRAVRLALQSARTKGMKSGVDDGDA